MAVRIPGWAQTVGTVLLGVASGAFVAGRIVADSDHATDDARRIADEATSGVGELRPRVATLEVWRASQEERWAHVIQLLEEVRKDVKDLRTK